MISGLATADAPFLTWMQSTAVATAVRESLLLTGFLSALDRVTERRIERWDEAARPPLSARMAGLTSVLLWTGVIMAGRMMSYTMF